MRRMLHDCPLAYREQSGADPWAAITFKPSSVGGISGSTRLEFAMYLLQCMALAWTIVFAAGAAEGHEVRAGKLVIVHPWVRAAPPGITSTAGHAKITNTGTVADRLIGASLSGALRAEIRSTTIVDGIATMRPLPDGIRVAPGQTVELRPGAFHIMFTDLTKSLEQDTYVDVSLTFEKAGEMAVEFFVEPTEWSGG